MPNPILRFLLALVLIPGFVAAAPSAQDAGPQHIANLGAKVAPHTTKTIFLVHMPPGSDVKEGTAQLVRILRGNDCHAQTFLIGSEDTARIAQIIVGAFSQLSPDSLAGCPIIVVAAQDDAERIRAVVGKTGAQLYFAPYHDPG